MNRKKLIISSAIALVITGTTGAVVQYTQSGAEEVPPIVTQVHDHEERIGTLEQKQEATDAKVGQNSNDIQTLQASSGASSGSESAPNGSDAPSAGSPATTAPTGSPAPSQPQPAPAPAIDKRTITAVEEQLDGIARSCRYTLYNDGVKPRNETHVYMAEKQQCLAVGEVLVR